MSRSVQASLRTHAQAGIGVALILGPLMIVGVGPAVGATSTPLDSNLVRNRGAENGGAGYPDDVVRSVPGWRRNGRFTVNQYGSAGFLPRTASEQIRGRRQYFSCGPLSKEARAYQRVRLVGRNAGIDSGRIKARLRAFVSAPASEGDLARIVLRFLDARGRKLDSKGSPWVSGTPTGFVARKVTRTVPRGTRTIEVNLRGVRRAGLFCNAYFDNVDLRLLPR